MKWLRTAALCLALSGPVVLPLSAWSFSVQTLLLGGHSVDYWVTHTPACIVNTICYNIFHDHIEISLSLRLPLP
jgi:predicted Co/Zn/Cd cation transporter (cation efflux family)